MNTINVILKNEWRTPVGRFSRSINGMPTPIPERVVANYPLPKTAVVVDDDYVPPDEREDNEPAAYTAAEQEAEIQRRVSAELALREAKARGDKMMNVAEKADEVLARGEDSNGDPGTEVKTENTPYTDILNQKVDDVIEEVEGIKDRSTLEALLDEENQRSKPRKGVTIALRAAIEDIDDEASGEG